MARSTALVYLAFTLPPPAPAACGDADGDPAGGGGSGGGGGGPPDPQALEVVCDVTSALCERQVACGHPIVDHTATLDACLASQACEATTADALELPGVAADLDEARSCAAAVRAASCEAVVGRGFALDPSCGGIWIGEGAVGDPCSGGTLSDCAPGLVCDFAGGACPGTCAEPLPSCAEGSCGDGSYCRGDGSCAPRAAPGGACDEGTIDFANLSEQPCVDGAYCHEGTCVATLAAGALCGDGSMHACGLGNACRCPGGAEGCQPSERTCQVDAALDGTCSWAFDCADGLTCELSTHTCEARAGEGGACTDSLGSCEHGLSCVNGSCATSRPVVVPEDAILLEEGDDCVSGGVCPLGTTCLCPGGDCNQPRVCEAAPGLGASCEAALQGNMSPLVCAEGLCNLFGGYTCVEPAAAGAPCTVEGFSLECASSVCEAGVCKSLGETRCDG